MIEAELSECVDGHDIEESPVDDKDVLGEMARGATTGEGGSGFPPGSPAVAGGR